MLKTAQSFLRLRSVPNTHTLHFIFARTLKRCQRNDIDRESGHCFDTTTELIPVRNDRTKTVSMAIGMN